MTFNIRVVDEKTRVDDANFEALSRACAGGRDVIVVGGLKHGRDAPGNVFREGLHGNIGLHNHNVSVLVQQGQVGRMYPRRNRLSPVEYESDIGVVERR